MAALSHIEQLWLDELQDLIAFMRGLSDEQWQQPSLCEGWRVREVAGHMALGYTAPISKLLLQAVRYGFDIDKVSAVGSVEFASRRKPAQLVDLLQRALDRGRKQQLLTGLRGRIFPPGRQLADNMVHHQDVRRPLGQPREIPRERLVTVLDLLPTLAGWGSDKRAEGLRLHAPDVSWERGSGPLVEGPGEAIAMVLSGRKAALRDLSGDGVQVLSSRS
ncbi:MAG TPA: maleylpyruvate isomerase family mycothiol-dependent enzyme [Chloroflexota bacterium]|jgi:uncharacterized protein (TIGR03083 family)